MEEEGSENVDDGKPCSIRRRDEGEPAPGRVRRRICRPDHSVRRVEVRPDLGAPESVVTECDRVGPGGEQPVGKARRDPDAVGRVLAIHNADVDT